MGLGGTCPVGLDPVNEFTYEGGGSHFSQGGFWGGLLSSDWSVLGEIHTQLADVTIESLFHTGGDDIERYNCWTPSEFPSPSLFFL